jgi:hypothetical protein
MSKIKDQKDPKYVIDFVDICADIDPTKTKKYAPYMLKLIEGYIKDVREDYEKTTFKDIKELFTDFEDLCERNQLENKDIYAYETFEDVEAAVKEGRSKITESQVKKKETKVIYEDDSYIVLRPLSIRSSRFYGSTTKWCTSSDRDDYASHFVRYSEGILVYFINKKADPKTNKFAKLAFHNETDFKEANNITVWDPEDKQLAASDMMRVAGKEIPFPVYEKIQEELYSKKKETIIKS